MVACRKQAGPTGSLLAPWRTKTGRWKAPLHCYGRTNGFVPRLRDFYAPDAPDTRRPHPHKLVSSLFSYGRALAHYCFLEWNGWRADKYFPSWVDWLGDIFLLPSFIFRLSSAFGISGGLELPRAAFVDLSLSLFLGGGACSHACSSLLR